MGLFQGSFPFFKAILKALFKGSYLCLGHA